MRAVYEYRKISELSEEINNVVNFYGKIRTITNKDEQLVFELEDETGTITAVFSNIIDNFVFKAEQIIRIHRARVLEKNSQPTVYANVGQRGCHFVVWKSGETEPENVAFISSKNWTRETLDKSILEKFAEDDEDIQELYSTYSIPDIIPETGNQDQESEDEVNEDETSGDEIIEDEINEDEMNDMYQILCNQIWPENRIKNICQTFLKSIDLTEKSDIEKLFRLDAGSTFNSGIYYKVQMLTNRGATSAIQWTVDCPKCSGSLKKHPYISRGTQITCCEVCREPLIESNLKICYRVNTINSNNATVVFTIPATEIKNAKISQYCRVHGVWSMDKENYENWCLKASAVCEEHFAGLKVCCSIGVVNSKSDAYRCAEVYVKQMFVKSV